MKFVKLCRFKGHVGGWIESEIEFRWIESEIEFILLNQAKEKFS